MDIKEALNRIVGQLDLTTEEMQAVMRQIMTGQCTDAQVGAFLMGMRMKSETIDEIVGAVQVMRELAAPVRFDTDKLVDTCGTGGDGMNIFNVSTAASFVVAAAGGKVAKHGNRAVSGKSGSADLLEAAGVFLDLTPEQVARSVDTVGVVHFDLFHGASKRSRNFHRSLVAFYGDQRLFSFNFIANFHQDFGHFNFVAADIRNVNVFCRRSRWCCCRSCFKL